MKKLDPQEEVLIDASFCAVFSGSESCVFASLKQVSICRTQRITRGVHLCVFQKIVRFILYLQN